MSGAGRVITQPITPPSSGLAGAISEQNRSNRLTLSQRSHFVTFDSDSAARRWAASREGDGGGRAGRRADAAEHHAHDHVHVVGIGGAPFSGVVPLRRNSGSDGAQKGPGGPQKGPAGPEPAATPAGGLPGGVAGPAQAAVHA